MGLFGPLANIIFSELRKISLNESYVPSDQFLRCLRLWYFHTLTQVAKKTRKIGLFGPFANFNFSELLKIGPNKFHGPSDQFPLRLRPLYFYTLTK